MSLFSRICFAVHGDDRGSLVALESCRDIPFEIKRLYYIFGTIPGTPRGFHAHRNLKQVFVCVSGACTILLDDGTVRESIRLTKPTEGILLEGVLWRELTGFTDDCVLLVLASEYYDELDYIRSYDEFRAIVM